MPGGTGVLLPVRRFDTHDAHQAAGTATARLKNLSRHVHRRNTTDGLSLPRSRNLSS